MKLCKHCRWSRMTRKQQGNYSISGLYCLHPEVKTGLCTDACDQWEREPGIDDDITEPRAQA